MATTKRNVSIEIKAVDHASGAIKKVKGELAGLNKPGASAGAGLNQAAAGVANVGKQSKPTIGALGQLKNGFKDAGVTVGNFSKALGPMGGIISGVTGSLGGVAAAVAAATAAVGFGVKAWLDYQEVFGEIGNIAKMFGQDSKATIKGIEDTAKAIGRLTGKSTLEYAEVGSTIYALTGQMEKAQAAMKTMAGMQAVMPIRARAVMRALTEAYQGNSDALIQLAMLTKKQKDELAMIPIEAERTARAIEMVSDKFDKMSGAADKNKVAIGNAMKDIKSAARDIGEVFAPMVVQFAEWTSAGITYFKKMRDEAGEYLAVLLGIKDVNSGGFKSTYKPGQNNPASYGGASGWGGTPVDMNKYNRDLKARGDAYEKAHPELFESPGSQTFADRQEVLRRMKISYGAENKGADLPLSQQKSFWESALKHNYLLESDRLKAQEELNGILRELNSSVEKNKKFNITDTREWAGYSRISSGFGTPRKGHTHAAVGDYPMPVGTPLVSAFAGKITKIQPSDKGSGGVYITYEIADEFKITLMHLKEINRELKVGQTITKGTLLGLSGQSGNATAPLTHREIRYKGVALNIPQANERARALGLSGDDMSWSDTMEAEAKALADLEKAQKEWLDDRKKYWAEGLKNMADEYDKNRANQARDIYRRSVGIPLTISDKSAMGLSINEYGSARRSQIEGETDYKKFLAQVAYQKATSESKNKRDMDLATSDYQTELTIINRDRKKAIDDLIKEMANVERETNKLITDWFMTFLGGLSELLDTRNAIKTDKRTESRRRGRAIAGNNIAAIGPIMGRDIQGNLTGNNFDYSGRMQSLKESRRDELAGTWGAESESIKAKYDKLKQELDRDFYNWQKQQEWYLTQFSAKELNLRLLDVKTSESDKQAIRTEFQRRARDGEIGGTTAFKFGLQENFNAFKTYQEMMAELGGQTATSMQTAFGDLFVDAFRNDLDNAGDIFDTFTRTIIDSWIRMLGEIAAQQIGTKLGFGNLLGLQGGGENPYKNPAFYAQIASGMAAAGGSTAQSAQMASGGNAWGLPNMMAAGGAIQSMGPSTAETAAGGLSTVGQTAAVMGAKGGVMGALGAASPYIAAALMVASLFKKGPGAPNSGPAAPLPQFTGINQIGGGLDVLRGSSFYTRAAFSPRNADGSVIAGMANLRTENEQKVKVEVAVKPSGMFESEVSNLMVEVVRFGNAAGVPRRTGFTHG